MLPVYAGLRQFPSEGRDYVYSLTNTNRSQNTVSAPTLFSVFVDRFNQAQMNIDEQFPPDKAINQHIQQFKIDREHSYIFSLARNASKLSQIHRTSGDEMPAKTRLHFLGPLMSTPELACMCQCSYPKLKLYTFQLKEHLLFTHICSKQNSLKMLHLSGPNKVELEKWLSG